MRRRNMYYATGLPGWMRFGTSPGWVGRSPSGLGPCAEYLTTGQWPAGMAGAMAGAVPPPTAMPNQPDRQQQLAFLQAQAGMLEQQLQAIREQLQQLDES